MLKDILLHLRWHPRWLNEDFIIEFQYFLISIVVVAVLRLRTFMLDKLLLYIQIVAFFNSSATKMASKMAF